MNPFQKLRRAVDKVTIDYQMPQQYQATKDNAYFPKEDQPMRKTKSKSSLNQPSIQIDRVNNIMLEQQTQYIQQINELSRKNQRLVKNLNIAEIEKQQLIQQVCVLQKNNEILEEKLNQIVYGQESSDDRERKYKQEIHRINKTIQGLGLELNSERAAKKAAVGQLNRFKEESTVNSNRDSQKVSQLQQRIKILEEEIQERSSMLEYNIKKNSEERRQNKMSLEKTKFQNDRKFEELNFMIQQLKDQLNSSKSKCDLLTHKLDTASAKADNYEHKHTIIENQLAQLQQQNKYLEDSLREANNTINRLTSQNQNIHAALRQQKQNVKLKVVEIRDETLELELQMYKRQCKDLLQQKAISQRLNAGRSFQPSYQVLQSKY